MTYTAADSTGSASQSTKGFNQGPPFEYHLGIDATGTQPNPTPPRSCPEIIASGQIQQIHFSFEGEQQIFIYLPTGIELSECFDRHAITLTAVEGQASVILAQDRIWLEPGVLIWIPAHTQFTVQPQTYFTGLLNAALQSDTDASIWVIHL